MGTSREYRRMSEMERFLFNMQKQESGCWHWTGYLEKKGYGRIQLKRGRLLAHRFSWELFKGVIPEGLQVLHECDNYRCVNPDHLFLGKNIDNVMDKVAKSRQTKGNQIWTCKLTEEKVREIRSMHGLCTRKGPVTVLGLAKKYKVSTRTIYHVWNGQIWRHVKEET
jgi:hypothetical protein